MLSPHLTSPSPAPLSVCGLTPVNDVPLPRGWMLSIFVFACRSSLCLLLIWASVTSLTACFLCLHYMASFLDHFIDQQSLGWRLHHLARFLALALLCQHVSSSLISLLPLFHIFYELLMQLLCHSLFWKLLVTFLGSVVSHLCLLWDVCDLLRVLSVCWL